MLLFCLSYFPRNFLFSNFVLLMIVLGCMSIIMITTRKNYLADGKGGVIDKFE